MSRSGIEALGDANTLPQSLKRAGLHAQPVLYRYRFCTNCRRELPAGPTNCPSCARWLGDRPLERIEWQIAPARQEAPSTSNAYELIGGCAVALRAIGDRPSDAALDLLAEATREAFAPISVGEGVCGADELGWFVWSRNGLRPALLCAETIERRLVPGLTRLQAELPGYPRFRWGAWLDQYVLPFGPQGTPAISRRVAASVFDFEPDDVLLSSEEIYRANRRWDNFVVVPRRAGKAREAYGYRRIGRKRPSLLDHIDVPYIGPFVGRAGDLAFLDSCYEESRRAHVKAAIIAQAGAGKTRLICEWLRRRSDVRVTVAGFSLFGGDIASFAGQLTDVPPDAHDMDELVRAARDRIERDGIGTLVLDDLHWADAAGAEFVRRLLDVLAPRSMLVLLISRPSGRHLLETLRPTMELRLEPLAQTHVGEMASGIVSAPTVAKIVAERSEGNPLFVEQFAAWAAEADYDGSQEAPKTLYEVVAARIALLSKARLSEIQTKLRWGRSWERAEVQSDLDALEREIGRWLDRLETGDYADRVEAARLVGALERLDFEIFLASALAGRARPRSNRLREAIERLIVGSGDEILCDLRARLGSGSATDNILTEALKAGDAAYGLYAWQRADAFYKLAFQFAPQWQQDEIGAKMRSCRRYLEGGTVAEAAEWTDPPDLENKPGVNALELPEVWIRLAQWRRSPEYFLRAARAAGEINDLALATWALGKASDLKA
jgi:hypothetical protein